MEPVFKKIYHSLRAKGRFIFSVEHPVMTSHQLSMKAGGVRQDWVVDRYFVTGQRTYPWLGVDVIKYHRTIEDYFQLLNNTGFQIVSLRESKPKLESFKDHKLYEQRCRIPLFLFFSGVKNENC